jgi:hypothetical protein
MALGKDFFKKNKKSLPMALLAFGKVFAESLPRGSRQLSLPGKDFAEGF